MGGGSKKHKRGSIPSSSVSSAASAALSAALSAASAETKIIERPSANIEMIERTAENDYGVMSDPEENSSSPTPLLEEEQDEQEEPTSVPSPSCPEKKNQGPTANLTVIIEGQELSQKIDDAHSYNPTEPSPASHEKQESSPSSQQQYSLIQPLIQPAISQTQAWSALETLQHKLTRDKNFSKKITLHTFFSYIILSIELHRASVSSIRDISVHKVEQLIEYMIDNHSASEDIRMYLRKLNETAVIKNIISAIIDFNNDDQRQIENLFITEQIELEMTTFNEEESTTDSSSAMMLSAASVQPIIHSSSRETTCGLFSCLRRFFGGCCG